MKQELRETVVSAPSDRCTFCGNEGAAPVSTNDGAKAYIDRLGCELLPDVPIFRTRGHSSGDGRPWTPRPYTSDILSKDFRLIRSLEFGDRENRTLADFRRSGAVEAIAGDATPAALAHAMGNTLHASNALFATYVPINASSLKAVLEARRRGRSKLR